MLCFLCFVVIFSIFSPSSSFRVDSRIPFGQPNVVFKHEIMESYGSAYAHKRASPLTILMASSTTTSQSTINVLQVSETSQLAQLSRMTTLSIDSGDIDKIQQYAATGYITDATTNPLFVAQTALKLTDDENSIYSTMVNDAVTYAVSGKISNTEDIESKEREVVALAMDRLAVNLGKAIADIVPGYISTEVDPRLSFDIDASVQRGLRIIQMYEEELGISKERVLIKLAATWEGIMAANILQEQHGIQCNLTLIFSVVQGIACGQYNVHLISPFPGRILDWYKVNLKRPSVNDPQDDEGVIACKHIYNYFKHFNHKTICMPASWRPSRGISTDADVSYDLDEIQALAGTDRMTIPVPLLEQLATSEAPLPQMLSSEKVKELAEPPSLIGNGKISEKEFRFLLAMDGCGNDKLAEGLRSFVDLTEQLEEVMTTKVREVMKK